MKRVRVWTLTPDRTRERIAVGRDSLAPVAIRQRPHGDWRFTGASLGSLLNHDPGTRILQQRWMSVARATREFGRLPSRPSRTFRAEIR